MSTKSKKKAAASVPAGPLIYLGPSLKDWILTPNALFKDGAIPGHVQKLAEEEPDLMLLIVPVSDLNATKAKIGEIGTPEHAIYEKFMKGV